MFGLVADLMAANRKLMERQLRLRRLDVDSQKGTVLGTVEIYYRGASANSQTLTLLDRNPHSPTYGCFDRNFWRYKIIDFLAAWRRNLSAPCFSLRYCCWQPF